MTGSSPAPLHGIRILDLSRIAAGPFCTMQLADLGAEVIKIERPGHGDDTRHMMPPDSAGEAHFYLAFNRNKQSVELDMKTEQGREIIHRLAEKCDVLVQNFRPGVMARLGLDYDAMRTRHPHLIYCSISSYGQEGCMSDRPGLDPVLQAEMGHMMLTGQPDGEPTRSPLSITDLFVGLYASTAILSAVVARGETGRGQHIDLALMDGAVATLSNFAQAYLCSGENPPRTGNMHSAVVPAAAFQARDGMFYLACGTQRLFESLCNNVLERPDFLNNPKFANNAARLANRDAVMTMLRDIFSVETLDHWMTKMRAAGVPAGPVRGVAEALESPEVQERGMVVSVPHPTAGEIRLVGTPYRLSDTPAVDPVAPPLRGQHTEAVLRGLLGLDDAAIASLRAAKTVP